MYLICSKGKGKGGDSKGKGKGSKSAGKGKGKGSKSAGKGKGVRIFGQSYYSMGGLLDHALIHSLDCFADGVFIRTGKRQRWNDGWKRQRRYDGQREGCTYLFLDSLIVIGALLDHALIY